MKITNIFTKGNSGMKRRISLLVIILVCFFVYSHVQLKSVHTWQSDVEFGNNNKNDQLTVATYNIRYGKGLDGRVNLDRTITTLKGLDADIISLQEVERFSVRSAFRDQVTQIAKALNMNVIYYPTLSYPGLYYGNVILSRFPIIDSDVLTFENIGENRSAIIAKIKVTDEEQFYVFNTHLGLNKEERLRSINEIYEVMKKLDKPVVLTGDLNSTPEMNEYEIWKGLLSKSNQGIPLQTFYKKDWQIDYIFHSSHFLVHDVSVFESVASDHFPVKGTFRLLTD
jgi:endonuclease/exonuclease/phosphatase family metal-dependent hydrolase